MRSVRRFGIFLAGFLLLLLSLSQASQAAVYKVDPDHSSVTFKIRHLLSNVTGHFKVFEGTIEYEPGKPETWKTSGSIDTDSIDTNVPERDKHLRSADFFDVEKFPKIEFKSTGVIDVSEDAEISAKLAGLLKLHGVEKPVILDVELHGVGKDPWGNVRAGFTATTKINRKDFGLSWNQALETGQLLVGEEVVITIEAEGILPQ